MTESDKANPALKDKYGGKNVLKSWKSLMKNMKKINTYQKKKPRSKKHMQRLLNMNSK